MYANFTKRNKSTRRIGITIVHDWIQTGKDRLTGNCSSLKHETTEFIYYIRLLYLPSRTPLSVNCLAIVHSPTAVTCRTLFAKSLRRIIIDALRLLYGIIRRPRSGDHKSFDENTSELSVGESFEHVLVFAEYGLCKYTYADYY